MIRKLSLSIILILAVILLASCQSTAQTAAANGGYSFGGTPGSRGTRTFNGTPNPLRLTQRAEGTTFPSGGGAGGGFGFGRGTPTVTATFPPLPTGTAHRAGHAAPPR